MRCFERRDSRPTECSIDQGGIHGQADTDHQQDPGRREGSGDRRLDRREPRRPAGAVHDVLALTRAGRTSRASRRLRPLRGLTRHARARARRDDRGARARGRVRLGGADRWRPTAGRAGVHDHRHSRESQPRDSGRGRPDRRVHAAAHAQASGRRSHREGADRAIRQRRLHPAHRRDRLLQHAGDDGQRLRARGGAGCRGAEGLDDLRHPSSLGGQGVTIVLPEWSNIRCTVSSLAELLGESAGIKAVRDKLQRLLERQQDVRRVPPVLIEGETGTGKGLLARVIHRTGPRRDGPFVDVNCAAIPETLLEAEMFGFERGAFTDARRAKPGLVQTAHKGLIFLDEVGLLPWGLQSKLLKFVEDRTVRRLGSTRSEPVDVWIITASNEDLGAAARQGGFREDLYHRLAVVTLWLPPLRERGDDIAVLAEHFLDRISRDYGLPPKSLAPDGRGALLAHPWPGNLRELSNVIERVALLEEAPLITREMLGLREPTAMETPQSADGEEAVPFKEELEGIERERLLQALRRAKWNIVRAAASLGIPRGTLRYRIEKYGLERGGALRTSPRRRAQPTVSEGPVTSAGADAEATPEPTHWEVRRLALLRAALVVRKASDALYTSRALEVIAEKTGSFGGRIQERGPTGIVAAFGLEPVEDAPRRSAHAAIAMQKAAERARRDDVERPGLKVAIHMAECLVRETGRRSEIDLEAKHRAWGVLEALVSDAEPDAILVSETAAPLLERRFDLVPLAGRGGGRPAFRLVGPERPGLEIGRRMSTFVGRRQA